MPNDFVDDLRIVGNVYVPSEVTSVVEDILVDFSIPILDEIHDSSEGTSDVDALVESSTLIPDDIYVHEDDTSDSEYVLVESSIPI